MNADRLLAHFDRIADAPDAMARLRRFILDLAVRGKLVEQDPNDEPASELLKRIEKEKARLVKAGEIRKTKASEPVGPDQQSFEVPRNWIWAHLSDIVTKLTDGTHRSPPNSPTGDFPYITAKNIKNEGVMLENMTFVSQKVHEEIFARCNPKKGDILYIKDGATTGVVTVNNLHEPFSMLSSVALLKLPSCLFNRLIVEFLRSPFFYDQMRGFMKGAAITRDTLKRMAPALFPLPPLPEQHRIVAKVHELMALCDRLDAARAEWEATRDRLAAASLARLNAPDPDPATFRNHAAFALENLAPLTTRVDQIKALRQTILNLAVRGKLVEQDPKDERVPKIPLSINEKRQGPDEVTIEAPFTLPTAWAWRMIGTIAEQVTDGEHATPPRIFEQQVPLVTAKNVRDGFMDYAQTDWVSFETADKAWKRCRPSVNDLLLVCVGATTGRLTVLREPKAMVLVRSVALIRPDPSVDSKFLERAIRSQPVQTQIWASVKAAAQPCLYINRTKSLLIPLPPLAEQHRIVAKVDELMAICEQLEASLATGADTRHRLLDALLYETLGSTTNCWATA